jgi:hypothetical protein
MSQQAASSQGSVPAQRSMAAEQGKQGKPRYHYRSCGNNALERYKSGILEIVNGTFNMGQNKFAAQFTESWKNVATYLQRTCNKGYLVAQMV